MNGQGENIFIAVGGSPVLLICNECLAVWKEYDLRRHFNAAFASFKDP